MSTGIHVELAFSSCSGCPVAALSASTPVEEVRVDSTDDRVEFVAADPPDNPPTELELVEFGGRAHGRYEIERGRSEAAGGRSADDAADRRRTTDDAATDGGVPVGAPTAEGGPSPGVSPVASSATSSDGEICADCSCGGLPAAFANFLAKSTVSEHLRTVTEELFSQTFGNRM